MSDHDSSTDPDALPNPPTEGGGFFDNPESPSVPHASEATGPYRVLARKYRPQTLDDLIGQESTVRILRRAFERRRVAHAFMLTGVRGVGKTTTARIIARALNCIGVDGKGGSTADPCGVCANCVAILADRHPDVLEMDAASRTGVDDIREIIEQTRFRPIQGRMKVFIIDEVHMLSRNAFNALLKTLEEPPDRVTFVFATTELRKVPVTVLSRCQRFDLRRVPIDGLVTLFERIAIREGVAFSAEALGLIARASDGSVRDGLSLLDQAIARGAEEGEDRVEARVVSTMLGLSDREAVYDLLQAVMDGDAARALGLTDEAYNLGVELGGLLSDLLDLLHFISRLKAVPALLTRADLTELERTRGGAFVAQLSTSVLGRAWQILINGLKELEISPDRRAATEMILIRLCYASHLPTPDELITLTRDARVDRAKGSAAPRGSSDASGAGSTQSRQRAEALPAGNTVPRMTAEVSPAARTDRPSLQLVASNPQPAGPVSDVTPHAAQMWTQTQSCPDIAAIPLAEQAVWGEVIVDVAVPERDPDDQLLRVGDLARRPEAAPNDTPAVVHDAAEGETGPGAGTVSAGLINVAQRDDGAPSSLTLAESDRQDAPQLPPPQSEARIPPPIRSWREMVAFAAWASQPLLHGLLRHAAHCVRFTPPEVAIRLKPRVDPRSLARLQAVLEAHHPGRFNIVSSHEEGEPTLDEQGAQVIEAHRQEMREHPMIRAIVSHFPDAKLGEPRDLSLDDYGLPPENLDDSVSIALTDAGFQEAGTDDLSMKDDDPPPVSHRYH